MKRILTTTAVLIILLLAGCNDMWHSATTSSSASVPTLHYDAPTGRVLLHGQPAQPKQIAAWLIHEKPEVTSLTELEMIPDSIHLQILEAGMIEMGVPLDTVKQVVVAMRFDHTKREPLQAAAASCQQVIEYEPCAGATGNRGWWSDPYCDGNPSDNEYIFAYYPTWSDTPDDVRWYTYNAYVYYALWVAYRANLLSRDACYPGIYLCIGDRGTWLAGGPVVVSLYVLIAHR